MDMEPNYVRDARVSGNIEGVVRAGLMAFAREPVSEAGVAIMLAACLEWWRSIHHGAEIDWRAVERAERYFGWDALGFMEAIGLA
jgi:hypothetical protein